MYLHCTYSTLQLNTVLQVKCCAVKHRQFRSVLFVRIVCIEGAIPLSNTDVTCEHIIKFSSVLSSLKNDAKDTRFIVGKECYIQAWIGTYNIILIDHARMCRSLSEKGERPKKKNSRKYFLWYNSTRPTVHCIIAITPPPNDRRWNIATCWCAPGS